MIAVVLLLLAAALFSCLIALFMAEHRKKPRGHDVRLHSASAASAETRTMEIPVQRVLPRVPGSETDR